MIEEKNITIINNLLVENIETIEFEHSLNDEFIENINRIADIIRKENILKEENIIILKLKIIIEISQKEKIDALDEIKKILIILLEINEFKRLIQDNYGIGKKGYWSFKNDFRQKELEIAKLESEFYLKKHCPSKNLKSYDEISLKFKKSMDRTNRRGWL